MEHDDNRSEISTLSSHVISVRTEEYVKQHTQVSSDFSTLPLNISSSTCAQESTPHLIDQSQRMNAAYDGNINTIQKRSRLCDNERLQSTRFQIPHTIYLIPSRILHLKHLHIKILLQKGIQSIQIHSITLKATSVLDFAKFIARRELVTTAYKV